MIHKPSSCIFDFHPMQQAINQIYKPKKPPDRSRHRSKPLDTCHLENPPGNTPSCFKDKDPNLHNTERMFSSSDTLSNPLMACKVSSKVVPQNSKLLAVKTFSFAMSIDSRSTLLRLYWRPNLVEEIQSTHEEGVFRVLMKYHEDKRKISEKRIWIMNDFMVLVEDWKCFCELGDLCFRHEEFKVQLLNLPRPLANDESIRKLIKRVGESSQVSLFLGVPVVQVKMDLRKPFWPAVPTVFRGLQIWVYLAYENLWNDCYACGILGHFSKQCKFVPKPFACEFHTTNGDFPYMKLGKRMKNFTRTNFQQKSAELVEDEVCNDKGRATTSSLNSDSSHNLVDMMDKICDSRSSEPNLKLLSSAKLVESEVHVDTIERETFKGPSLLPKPVVAPGKIERIPDTILRQQLIFGAPFLANKSSDIFQQASVTAQVTPPASKDMLSTDESQADLCPLGKIIQEGKYPITNFFSPQYSALVANFLLRRQARISLQVSMVEEFPSVIVDLSCSKSILKKYHRRPRNTTPKHSHHMQLRSSVDWVASPPLAKSRKLNHVEDIKLDTKRNLESKSDVPTLQKRKGRELKKETHTLAYSDAAKKFPTDHLKSHWKGKKPCSGDAQLEPRDTVVNLKGWKLSKDEEIALSTLSLGLRESGLLHLSYSQ